MAPGEVLRVAANPSPPLTGAGVNRRYPLVDRRARTFGPRARRSLLAPIMWPVWGVFRPGRRSPALTATPAPWRGRGKPSKMFPSPDPATWSSCFEPPLEI